MVFLELAREDLAAAELLRPGYARQAAFHLQQAAEKLIKGILALEGIPFGRSHQLGALAVLLPGEHAWRADLTALDRLTSFATALRYPAPGGGLPTAPDAADLADISSRLTPLLAAAEHWVRANSKAS